MSVTEPSGPAPIDTHSLSEWVDRATVTAHAARLQRETGVRARVSRFNIGCSLAIALAIGIPATAVFGVLALDQGVVWAVVASIVLIATAGVCILIAVAAARQNREAPELRYRLERFAHDNGLTYSPEAREPDFRGRIFARGEDRRAHDVVRWPGDALEVANYSFTTTGYRGTRSVWQWGYATAPLAGAAPALLLDARKNNGVFDDRITNPVEMLIPTELSAPDGSRYTLWARPGDVRSATAAIDTTVLARLSERAVDVEITDARLYLYSTTPMSTRDPELWRWIHETIRLIQLRAATIQPE